MPPTRWSFSPLGKRTFWNSSSHPSTLPHLPKVIWDIFLFWNISRYFEISTLPHLPKVEISFYFKNISRYFEISTPSHPSKVILVFEIYFYLKIFQDILRYQPLPILQKSCRIKIKTSFLCFPKLWYNQMCPSPSQARKARLTRGNMARENDDL